MAVELQQEMNASPRSEIDGSDESPAEPRSRAQLAEQFDVAVFEQLFPEQPEAVRVLQIGARDGRFTISALDRCASLIATVESEDRASELRQRLRDADLEDRCTIQIENRYELTFADRTFDCVVALDAFADSKSVEEFRAATIEACRKISKSGSLIFNYRNRRSLYGLLSDGFAPTPKEVSQVLTDCGMRVTEKRGKWFTHESVERAVPGFVMRLFGSIDRLMLNVWPNAAGAVFIVAQKR